MFGELQALRLIVRADALAVERVRTREHRLINEAADDLPVLEDKRHLARAHLEHRAAALAARADVAETRIEKARVMHAEFSDQWIERHHLGGEVGRHLHGFFRGEDVELVWIQDQRAVWTRAHRLPELREVVA